MTYRDENEALRRRMAQLEAKLAEYERRRPERRRLPWPAILLVCFLLTGCFLVGLGFWLAGVAPEREVATVVSISAGATFLLRAGIDAHDLASRARQERS